ncbi:uncharacterized protein LOC110599092 [Ictidomys tridecemlineatus]
MARPPAISMHRARGASVPSRRRIRRPGSARRAAARRPGPRCPRARSAAPIVPGPSPRAGPPRARLDPRPPDGQALRVRGVGAPGPARFHFRLGQRSPAAAPVADAVTRSCGPLLVRPLAEYQDAGGRSGAGPGRVFAAGPFHPQELREPHRSVRGFSAERRQALRTRDSRPRASAAVGTLALRWLRPGAVARQGQDCRPVRCGHDPFRATPEDGLLQSRGHQKEVAPQPEATASLQELHRRPSVWNLESVKSSFSPQNVACPGVPPRRSEAHRGPWKTVQPLVAQVSAPPLTPPGEARGCPPVHLRFFLASPSDQTLQSVHMEEEPSAPPPSHPEDSLSPAWGCVHLSLCRLAQPREPWGQKVPR